MTEQILGTVSCVEMFCGALGAACLGCGGLRELPTRAIFFHLLLASLPTGWLSLLMYGQVGEGVLFISWQSKVFMVTFLLCIGSTSAFINGIGHPVLNRVLAKSTLTGRETMSYSLLTTANNVGIGVSGLSGAALAAAFGVGPGTYGHLFFLLCLLSVVGVLWEIVWLFVLPSLPPNTTRAEYRTVALSSESDSDTER